MQRRAQHHTAPRTAPHGTVDNETHTQLAQDRAGHAAPHSTTQHSTARQPPPRRLRSHATVLPSPAEQSPAQPRTVMDRLVRWISGMEVGSISFLYAASVYSR